MAAVSLGLVRVGENRGIAFAVADEFAQTIGEIGVLLQERSRSRGRSASHAAKYSATAASSRASELFAIVHQSRLIAARYLRNAIMSITVIDSPLSVITTIASSDVKPIKLVL